jgi:hypothetical protein
VSGNLLLHIFSQRLSPSATELKPLQTLATLSILLKSTEANNRIVSRIVSGRYNNAIIAKSSNQIAGIKTTPQPMQLTKEHAMNKTAASGT